MASSFGETCSALSDYIKETLPHLIPMPDDITKIQFLSNESDIIGISRSGLLMMLKTVSLHSKISKSLQVSSRPLENFVSYRNDSLVIVQETEFIYFIELSGLRVKKTIKIELTGTVCQIFMTPDEKYIISRLDTGEITKWKTDSTGVIKSIENPNESFKSIKYLHLSPDYMVIVWIGKRLMLFSNTFEKITEKKFHFVFNGIMNFSPSSKFLVLSHKNKIYLLYKNNLEELFSLIVDSNVKYLGITNDEKYIIASQSNGRLIWIDILRKLQVLSVNLTGSLKEFMYITKDNSKLYILADTGLHFMKMPLIRDLMNATVTLNSVNSDPSLTPPTKGPALKQKSIDHQFKVICKEYSPGKDIVMEAGYCNDIYIWSFIKCKSKLLIGHSNIILCLAVLNDNILASGSSDNDIRVWNYRKKTCLKVLRGHIADVKCLVFKDKWLVSGSEDCTVKIWEWDGGVLHYTISLDLSVSGLAYWKNTLFIGVRNCVQLWDMDGYGFIGKKNISCQVDGLKIIENGKKIMISVGQELCIDNPLYGDIITIWGNDDYYNFLQYTQEILSEMSPDYSHIMDSFIIMPYRISILHIYSYKNLCKHLEHSIKNGSSLYNTIKNENPVNISIKYNHKDCLISILESFFISKSLYFQLSILKYEDLLGINLAFTEEIHKLYKMIWHESTTLQKYCSYNTKLPITYLSDSNHVYLTNFVLLNEEHTVVEVDHFTSLVALPIETGTKASIEFLESVLASHQSIYSTDMIRSIIQYKWERIKWYFQVEGAVYLSYFICLIASIVYISSQTSLIQTNILGCAISFWMLFKIVAVKNLNGWNILDIFRFLLMVLYSLEKFCNTPYEIEYVFILVILLSCMQGLQYFKIFPATRLIVKKVIKALLKILSFIGIIAFLLGVLALVLVFTPDKLERNHLAQESFENLFVCIISLFMLCLLLSISKEDHRKTEELIEMTRIICEYEKIIICKRKKISQKFFQQCKQSTSVKTSYKKKLFAKTDYWESPKNEIFEKLELLEERFKVIEEKLKSVN
jgi:WD40 repeat protein